MLLIFFIWKENDFYGRRGEAIKVIYLQRSDVISDINVPGKTNSVLYSTDWMRCRALYN